MPSAKTLLLFASVAYQSLAAPVDIAARDVSYDDGQYHWSATNAADDGQWHPDPTGAAPDSAVNSVAPTSVPAPLSLPPAPLSLPPVSAISKPAVVSTSHVVVVPTSKAVTSAKVAAPTTKVASPTTAKAAPSHTSAESVAAPTATNPGSSDQGGAGWTAKKPLSGDGSKWPTVDQWVTFDKMWTANQKDLGSQCTGKVQNSAADIKAIKDGITAEAKTSGVDERFILAVIMQESHGCVRVGATTLGVNNPGIMQDHNGPNNCVGAAAGACSAKTIAGMIHDGTSGTVSLPGGGSGLKQDLDIADKLGAGKGAQRVYWAARLYNSGDSSYKKGDDLSNPPDATASYASDIANRLMGLAF